MASTVQTVTEPTRSLKPDRYRGLYFAMVLLMTYYDARGARLIALMFLLLSATGAVAQLPPPPIHVVPNLNPSSLLVLPGPGRIAPTSPTLSAARGRCYGTHQIRRHQLKKDYAVSGAEAVPLIFKNGLSKCNDGLPSVLTWLSKVYSEKQAGALGGSNQEQSLRDDYDDRMKSRFESRSPCTAPRDRGSSAPNRSNSDDRRDRATSPDRQQNGPLDLTRASKQMHPVDVQSTGSEA